MLGTASEAEVGVPGSAGLDPSLISPAGCCGRLPTKKDGDRLLLFPA